jgi:hypothetical protein
LVESRTFRRVEPAAAAAAAPSARGLGYEYYEGRFEKLPDLAAMTPARTGTAARPAASVAKAKDEFVLRFRGFIRVPRPGVYVFYLSSDDGSRLSIAGRELIVNDGVHGLTEEKGEIALQAGWHPIEIAYFQGTGGMGLELSWRGPGIPKSPVPAYDFGR